MADNYAKLVVAVGAVDIKTVLDGFTGLRVSSVVQTPTEVTINLGGPNAITVAKELQASYGGDLTICDVATSEVTTPIDL